MASRMSESHQNTRTLWILGQFCLTRSGSSLLEAMLAQLKAYHTLGLVTWSSKMVHFPCAAQINLIRKVPEFFLLHQTWAFHRCTICTQLFSWILTSPAPRKYDQWQSSHNHPQNEASQHHQLKHVRHEAPTTSTNTIASPSNLNIYENMYKHVWTCTMYEYVWIQYNVLKTSEKEIYTTQSLQKKIRFKKSQRWTTVAAMSKIWSYKKSTLKKTLQSVWRTSSSTLLHLTTTHFFSPRPFLVRGQRNSPTSCPRHALGMVASCGIRYLGGLLIKRIESTGLSGYKCPGPKLTWTAETKCNKSSASSRPNNSSRPLETTSDLRFNWWTVLDRHNS